MSDLRVTSFNHPYNQRKKKLYDKEFSFEGLTISILGCGWLGLPLAMSLIQKKAIVKGSTTTSDKLKVLSSYGLSPYLINIEKTNLKELPKAFFNSKVVIITLPFRRNFEPPSIYVEMIKRLIPYLINQETKQVIFTSSTGIYPNTNRMVTETEPINLKDPRPAALYEVEQLLLKQSKFESSIIRFAGLYGPDRELGGFLKSKRILKNGKSPVNLIHLDDCIGIIETLIKSEIKNTVVNAVSDLHPKREDLYRVVSTQKGMPAPKFWPVYKPEYKIVSNKKLKQDYNYQFIHPDPMGL